MKDCLGSGETIASRRRFLSLVGAAVTLAGCSGGGDSGPAPFGDVSAGNVADIAPGSLRLVDSDPVIIGRDEGGLYAMTNTCTHQGCDAAPTGSGDTAQVRCPCHGSRYDRNGAVVQGPAPRPLRHFDVSIADDGEVTIHGGSGVDASKRTAVPA